MGSTTGTKKFIDTEDFMRGAEGETTRGKKAEGKLFHYAWTQENQSQHPETALASPLLDLHKTSDVDDIKPRQVRRARRVLRLRREIIGSPGGPEDAADSMQEVRRLQRRIVETYLEGRREHFGPEQCLPFEGAVAMVRENRDIFLNIKFMDEAPHIRATLQTLLNQKRVDMSRVVIIGVDNNSTDGSDEIVKEMASAHNTKARIIYTNQPTPGGGSAARFGVDRCIATIHQMCLHDGNWDRLEKAVIAVSDGDTVYHHHLLNEIVDILDNDPSVDGVMPFLVYKFTAALRLFSNYTPVFPDDLQARVDPGTAIEVHVDLSHTGAHDVLPRWGRRRIGDRLMELDAGDDTTLSVELKHRDSAGRQFGVLRDARGNHAYLFEDRSLVLSEAPVSGTDAALVFLENGGVEREEKWRWHSAIGHDMFLMWAFLGMGLPEEMIFPDTSDALKMFRAWSFSVGGQHQLSRPDLPIVTGTDYQSGRILQAVGNTVRLGPSHAYAETEIDRLIKMIRNMARQQSVFYGETRSDGLARSSGMYLHMTRIQDVVEKEIVDYPDEFFQTVFFPERLLFPLRWMLQNAVRFYAHYEPEAQEIVREKILNLIFSAASAETIECASLGEENIKAIREAEYCKKLEIAERIAEDIIDSFYPEIMTFYKETLRSFFTSQRVAGRHYEWLLDDLEETPSAIAEARAKVHPSAVWQGEEFVIDSDRGQVVRLRAAKN